MTDGPQYQAVRLPDGKHLPPVETRYPPGVSGNPGGKPKGANIVTPLLREMAKGAVIGEDGEVIKYGDKSEEAGQVLYELATGKRDPSSVDSKALLALIDRTDGPLVKERVQTNIEVLESVEMRDRRMRPAPGTETKQDADPKGT